MYYSKAHYVVLRRKKFPKKFDDFSKPLALLFFKDSTLLGSRQFLGKKGFLFQTKFKYSFMYYSKAHYVVLRRKKFPKKFDDFSKPLALLFFKDSTLLGSRQFLGKKGFLFQTKFKYSFMYYSKAHYVVLRRKKFPKNSMIFLSL